MRWRRLGDEVMISETPARRVADNVGDALTPDITAQAQRIADVIRMVTQQANSIIHFLTV